MSNVFFYNGPILTLDNTTEIIDCGWLEVAGGKVAGYGEYSPGHTLPDNAELVDLAGNLLMPGLVNAHTHAAMTLLRGFSDDLPLMEWLGEIFQLEKNLTADWVLKGTRLACLEMIRSGTTTAADMYIYEDSAMEAFAQSGMRALCGEGMFDFPSPSLDTVDAMFDEVERLAKKWQGHETVRLALAPHATYTCCPELLKRAGGVAEKYGLMFHTHVSETENEVQMVTEKYGKSPLLHLDDLGLVNERLMGAHMVWLSDEEIRLAADKGVKMLHCPESNMKLASGFAEVGALSEAGVCVALGTDGTASNNNLDMFSEMDYAAKIHKGHKLDATLNNDREVLKMATINGAKALGMDDVTGSLAVGKSADMIVIDYSAPHLCPVYDHISHLVYAVNGSDVLHTMVAGKWLMKDREVLTLDQAQVIADVHEIADEARKLHKNHYK